MIDVDNNDLVNNTNVQHNNENLVGFNKIYYGIPGCGKSYKVSSMLKYKDGSLMKRIKMVFIQKLMKII